MRSHLFRPLAILGTAIALASSLACTVRRAGDTSPASRLGRQAALGALATRCELPKNGADAGPALSACVAATAPGGVLSIPAGRYTINSVVTFDRNVTVTTEGKAAITSADLFTASTGYGCYGDESSCATLVIDPNQPQEIAMIDGKPQAVLSGSSALNTAMLQVKADVMFAWLVLDGGNAVFQNGTYGPSPRQTALTGYLRDHGFNLSAISYSPRTVVAEIPGKSFTVVYSVIKNSAGFDQIYAYGPGGQVTIANSYFASAGLRGHFASDHFTAALVDRLSLFHNYWKDTTDHAVVVFGAQRASITGNTFVNDFDAHAFIGLFSSSNQHIAYSGGGTIESNWFQSNDGGKIVAIAVAGTPVWEYTLGAGYEQYSLEGRGLTIGLNHFRGIPLPILIGEGTRDVKVTAVPDAVLPPIPISVGPSPFADGATWGPICDNWNRNFSLPQNIGKFAVVLDDQTAGVEIASGTAVLPVHHMVNCPPFLPPAQGTALTISPSDPGFTAFTQLWEALGLHPTADDWAQAKAAYDFLSASAVADYRKHLLDSGKCDAGITHRRDLRGLATTADDLKAARAYLVAHSLDEYAGSLAPAPAPAPTATATATPAPAPAPAPRACSFTAFVINTGSDAYRACDGNGSTTVKCSYYGGTGEVVQINAFSYSGGGGVGKIRATEMFQGGDYPGNVSLPRRFELPDGNVSSGTIRGLVDDVESCTVAVTKLASSSSTTVVTAPPAPAPAPPPPPPPPPAPARACTFSAIVVNVTSGAYRPCDAARPGFNTSVVCSYQPGPEAVRVTFASSGGAGKVRGGEMFQALAFYPGNSQSLGPFVLPVGVSSGTIGGQVDDQEICSVTVKKQ